MMFNDSLTIGVVAGGRAWLTDYTIAFARYFGQKFGAHVLRDVSVDNLLNSCTTKHLLILKTGTIIHGATFFEQLEQFKDELFFSAIELTETYAVPVDHVMLVNVDMWKAAERPLFKGKQGVGVKFSIGETALERTGDNTMILHDEAIRGARFISEQLRVRGAFREFPQSLEDETYHFDSSSPFMEIYSETWYEQNVLKRFNAQVVHDDCTELEDLVNGVADTIVCHGAGYAARALAEHYNAKRVVIYDVSEEALNFQRLLFSVEQPTLYGDIVATYKDEFKGELSGDFDEDEYTVVQPFKGSVEYRKVDVFGYQLVDLIRDVGYHDSMVFNLSNIFMLPFNYYKRPRSQMYGLFREAWSQLVSRIGPTRFIGCDSYGKWVKGEIINGDIHRFQVNTEPALELTA